MSKPKLCDDWDCPAKASCRHHFVRSRAYNAMLEHAGPFFKGDRRQTEPLDPLDPEGPKKVGLRDHCDLYVRDRAKPWLMPQPGQVTHTGPWDGRLMPCASRA